MDDPTCEISGPLPNVIYRGDPASRLIGAVVRVLCGYCVRCGTNPCDLVVENLVGYLGDFGLIRLESKTEFVF